jgi:type VI secretion system ImpC/EvpB family protein
VLAPFADGVRAEGRTVCAIADFAFGADHEEELLGLAHAAEAARVPVVANATISLLGIRTFAELDKLDNLGAVLGDDDHVRYGAIRDDEASRWVSLVFNRLLLRAPYGAEHDRVREFAFEENPVGEDAHYLWGGAAWGIGALIATSVERTGWGTVLLGPGDDTSLAELPIRPLTLRTGEVVNCPLETLLSEPRVLELSEGGITALACRRNSDAAFTVSAVTLRRPEKGEGRAAASEPRRVSLAYALFLAQASALLDHIAAWIDRSRAPAEIATTVAQGLEFLCTTREGVVLNVRAEEVGEDRVSLRLSPAAPPLRGLPDTVLEIPLH